MIRTLTQLGRCRWQTHGALALLTLGGLDALHSLVLPHADLGYLLTIGCGYLSLVYLAVTLLIGPFRLLGRRRNPVHLDLRRDVGIWAGLTGLVHVIFGLQVHPNSGVIGYFARWTGDGYALLTNRFGIANWTGLIATLALLVLLLTSNDWSLRRLKGRRWKTLQRLNYVLTGLALLHTVLYQQRSGREPFFVTTTLLLTVAVLAAQYVGIQLYRAGANRRRRPEPTRDQPRPDPNPRSS
ncbi:MAG: ferric reductase-like transmembrane domain-containing protein [Anaerolineae bacterium]|nr:ferric reductase-like transmembrane domain-containing protein [Anaerolineae bacterium]